MTFMNLIALDNLTKPFHWTWLEAQEVPLTQEQNFDLKGILVSIFSFVGGENTTFPLLQKTTLYR